LFVSRSALLFVCSIADCDVAATLFCFLAAAADQDLFAETDGTTKTMVDGQGLAVIFDRREEPRPQRCAVSRNKQTNAPRRGRL
jgi:hypothetical protein